jgi:hypothetical protein
MAVEQTRIEWAKLLDEALTAPGSLGNVYSRFHDYSLTNMFLFMMQGIHEPVASFSRWKSLGRHVVRGARAKEVIVPVLVNEPAPEPAEVEPLEEKRERIARLIGFKVVRAVFALSDTDGSELPPMQLPTWDLPTALAELAIRQVPFESTNGNLQGYSNGREIAVNPVAVHPAKTTFHELGHVVLGHTVASSIGEYAQHRGVMEIGAEAVAYLAMNELELMDDETASHGRGYIRHWLGEEHPGDREIRFVFAATDQILKAGRVAPYSAPRTDDI